MLKLHLHSCTFLQGVVAASHLQSHSPRNALVGQETMKLETIVHKLLLDFNA